MAKNWKYCPCCKSDLETGAIDEHEYLICSSRCGFIDWDNPKCVVVVVIKIGDKYVLVKRKNNPGKGKWCIICGFNNKHERLDHSAIRETLEEGGLIVTVPELPFRIITLEDINEHLMFFMGTITGGELTAGDDAEEADVFSIDELPEMAFATHEAVLKELSTLAKITA